MRIPRTRIWIVAALVAVGILVAGAQSAFASLTLDLTVPDDAVVGTPNFVTASGTIPPEDFEYPYWFSLDAIPTSVTTTCPADHFVGAQVAQSTGGAIIVLTQREVPDANGNFSIPVGITPSAAGSVLLCGYTDDGLTNTLASASAILNIRERPSTPSTDGSQPQTPSTGASQGRVGAGIPSQTRAAITSCKALLAGRAARSCIRDVVARGKSRCRRLHPRSRRAACVRAVRRVARVS